MKKSGVGTYAGFVVILVWCLLPIAWIVSLSFKDPASITDRSFWPKQWTWDNYSGIFQTSEFTRALINSIGIALISTFVAVLFASREKLVNRGSQFFLMLTTTAGPCA